MDDKDWWNPILSDLGDWPYGAGGTPYTFLAQFNLSGSEDILPKLPGELLLVFSKDFAVAYGGLDELAFVWKNITNTSPGDAASFFIIRVLSVASMVFLAAALISTLVTNHEKHFRSCGWRFRPKSRMDFRSSYDRLDRLTDQKRGTLNGYS